MNIYIKYLLKALFLFAIIFIINLIVFTDENIIRIYSLKYKLNTSSYIILLIVFLLQFINWGLEALKFKYIISKKAIISFKESILAIYTGNATGFMTPDRLGNFIGRFIFLKGINKRTVTAATMLGNLAQLISTITFAFISLLLYFYLDLRITIPYINPVIVLSATMLILFILIYSFYNPIIILNFLNKFNWIAKHKRTFDFLNNFTNKETSFILGVSIFRYTIFIIQFHLLLNILGLQIELIETLVFSGLLYLFTTLIPSPFMGNLGTRELIALLLLSSYQLPEIALIASLVIWLINVIFPSLVGSLILIKMNPSKQKV